MEIILNIPVKKPYVSISKKLMKLNQNFYVFRFFQPSIQYFDFINSIPSNARSCAERNLFLPQNRIHGNHRSTERSY